jgi:PD-(D/E)XK endonuclease
MCSMQDTNTKGAVAEQAFVLAAVKLGVRVLKPVSAHTRYDLAIDVGGRLWRVQCKWGRLGPGGDVVTARISTRSCVPGGYRTTVYSEEEVDLFGIYCGVLDRCFLIPWSLAVGKHNLHLRLTAPRNGQRACINLASSFEFEGAIAQLGERLAGSQKVVGSSPTSSTSPHDPSPPAGSYEEPTTIGSHIFREQLGWWMERAAAGEEILVTRRGKPRLRLSPAAAMRGPP